MFGLRYLSVHSLKNYNVYGPLLRFRGYHLQPCLRCQDRVPPVTATGVNSDQQTRNFSKVTDNPGTELYFEEIFEHGFSEDPLFDLRNYFYPESEDPTIIQLSNAGCVMEVLDLVTSIENPEHQHITQVGLNILILFEDYEILFSRLLLFIIY